MHDVFTTEIEGCLIINLNEHIDNRGSFTKIFFHNAFSTIGLDVTIKEIYYTISNKNVLRGMHFQSPPMEHDKIVHCVNGEVIDVVLDIRKNSKTFGRSISFNLSDKKKQIIYIPKGIAHGFLSLENNSTLIYGVSSEYNKDHDTGILWSSFGFKWPVTEPIISERDSAFTQLTDFDSPF